MAETAAQVAVDAGQNDGRPGSGNLGDRIFSGTLWILGGMVLVVAGLIILNLAQLARPLAEGHSLWGFVTSTEWNPIEEHFGALPFLYGTLVTSALAIAVAVPIAVGLALFITQFAPAKLGRALTIPVELLAAIPSVVYGLWGLFIVVPWVRESVEPWLGKHLGFLPIFQGPPIGLGYLSAGLILAVMILPTVVTVSVEVMRTTPEANREAALALGATKWEAVMMAVIPYSRAGIVGAILLGLGRALGETMAVTMVIGNSPQISASLFAPGYTLPAVIANEFAEATSNVHIGALAGLGLILFATTFLLNAAARVLVNAVQKGPKRATG
ncbi:MAG TPA: phosphate ABC transporter permease subunit PstC [Myxococcaceae bacterium]|nr:phosphate ABC transporter permease subunit PstC [Myxococcaceae bacterium]